MGTRRVRAMVPGDLVGLKPVCPAHGGLDETLGDPASTWARAAQDRWGLCGVLVCEGDLPVAGALVCPALNLPAGHPLERWARRSDVAYLLALTCADPEQGGGGTRLLVQGLSRHLQGQVAAVEAVGQELGSSCLVPPVSWLMGAGFHPVEDEQREAGQQLLRLDVDAGVQWLARLDRAWGVLSGLVTRPVRPAEPTGRDAD